MGIWWIFTPMVQIAINIFSAGAYREFSPERGGGESSLLVDKAEMGHNRRYTQ